ncbi:MAG: acyl-CoA thioesterase [Deltaproteobacteria bacterium]|nr:acyl-CoA thioesterase [Deltaproteobacteria bacterium]
MKQKARPSRSQFLTPAPRHPAPNTQHPTPSTHTIRVRYAETDQAGMAHHAAFLLWFEEGRVELLRSLGKPYQEFEAEGLHFPVREAFCRYWLPARFDEVLTVATVIEEVGGASIRFGYRITRESGAVLLAEGYTRHACVDNTGKIRRLPLEARKMLSS